jgi:adenylate cyclase
MGAATPRPLPAPVSREHILVREVVSRSPEDRPAGDTVDGVAEWLVGPARHNPSGAASFDEFAWRLLAAGLPLLRVTLHVGTIHPQFLGTTMVWWRDTGRTTQVLIGHEIADAIPYEKNPVRRVCEGGETLRRGLDLPDDQLDFDVLFELRERGGTDYLALPIAGAHAVDYMVTFVTDRVGGFTANEIDDLSRVAQRLAVVVDRYSQEWVTRNVLTAYLGVRTGPKVLAGQIRRGHGVELTAVLWSSDLRGFTERSDRLPPDRMIEIVNALFDAQAIAIRDHCGEILKFIGDGILAMFPIEERATISGAARSALSAAHAALAAVQRLADDPVMADEPPLEIVVALHVGTVTYGNIGATDRLDFTVIGPAVNLVSRIEGVASPRSADPRQQRLRESARGRRGGLPRPTPSARIGNAAGVVRSNLGRGFDHLCLQEGDFSLPDPVINGSHLK